MEFNALYARHILGRDPKCLSLVVALNRPMKMNHAILDDDVQQMSPGLVLEGGDELLANGPIVHTGGRFRSQSGHTLEQVASRHNAHELAVTDHRDALDAMPRQGLCEVGEGGGLIDRDHIRGHYFASRAAVRLDIVPR